jgi:hypothetical protein
MSIFSRITRYFIATLAVIAITAGSVYAFGVGSAALKSSGHAGLAAPNTEQEAIDIASNHPPIRAVLDLAPDWSASAWEEDEEEHIWGVEFWMDQAQTDWMGWAAVDLDTSEVLEYEMIALLSPEEEARQRTAVNELVLADAEVLALLGNPAEWDVYTEYDPWEGFWYVYFGKGLEAWAVEVQYEDADHINIQRIFDPAEFTEEEAQRVARDQAIELAYEADNLWEALENYDDWKAYASQIDGPRWAVSFVSGEQELFYALVDIEAWEILETDASQAELRSYLPFQNGR